MKVLIAYYSKSNTTETCAKILKRELATADVTLCDLSADTPGLEGYDVAVIGTPVRMGKVGKPFLSFVQQNATKLEKMPHGFFICCLNEENFESAVEKFIPEPLAKSAFAVEYFGGELSVSRQRSFFEKMIVRAMRSSILTNYESNDVESDSALPTVAEPVIAQYAQKTLKAVRDAQKDT